MGNLFNSNDAVLAKYELEKFISINKIRFNYKYHTHDSALKHMYILSRIESFLQNNNKSINVLDVGCGNGDALRMINKVYGAKSIGFDPILGNRRIRISNLRKRLLKNNPKLLNSTHDAFLQNHKDKKFDLIIDLCAVTHFDTTEFKSLNLGWKWISEHLEQLLVKNGKFISATDVAIKEGNNEFFRAESIISFLLNYGSISNVSEIHSSNGSKLINSTKIIIDKQPFYRIGKTKNSKTSPVDEIVLGVLGLEVTV
jgi:SAM-dependent methyltransferase